MSSGAKIINLRDWCRRKGRSLEPVPLAADISPWTHQQLSRIASRAGMSIEGMLARAIEESLGGK